MSSSRLIALDLPDRHAAAELPLTLPARPRKPRDKAKVETGVLVVERWILARLRHRTFFSLGELNAEARLWCGSVANVRIHGTTGVRPVDRLEEERRAMQPHVGPRTLPESVVAGGWPRYPLQRSPKDYDVVLQEVGR